MNKLKFVIDSDTRKRSNAHIYLNNEELMGVESIVYTIDTKQNPLGRAVVTFINPEIDWELTNCEGRLVTITPLNEHKDLGLGRVKIDFIRSEENE